MPIIGIIEPAYHRCRPESTSYATYTAYQCDTCGQLWILQDDERGNTSWQRPSWWQRGKIKKLIAIQRKTVARTSYEESQGHTLAQHSQDPPRALAVPSPPPNISGSTHLSRRAPRERPFMQPPPWKMTPAERQAAMRNPVGAASE